MKWTKGEVKATFVNVTDIWRKKTSLQSYGNLICTHSEEISFKFTDCQENKCILFIMVKIVVRMVRDLLKMALIKTKLIKPPARDDWTKSAKNWWRRQFARYLLYVIQKTKLIQLKKEHKNNLLYQVGYNENLSLSNVFDEQEKQVLESLPY